MAESYGSECPSCVAMVVCNEIIEDRWTNNKSLIGLFSTIATPGLPAQHSRMFIMASLTDGRGEWPFVMRIESPSGEELFKAESTLFFDDPLMVHDVVMEVRGLPLPEAGEYHVWLVCGNRLVGSRRFTVVEEDDEDEE